MDWGFVLRWFYAYVILKQKLITKFIDWKIDSENKKKQINFCQWFSLLLILFNKYSLILRPGILVSKNFLVETQWYGNCHKKYPFHLIYEEKTALKHLKFFKLSRWRLQFFKAYDQLCNCKWISIDNKRSFSTSAIFQGTFGPPSYLLTNLVTVCLVSNVQNIIPKNILQFYSKIPQLTLNPGLCSSP